MNNITLGKALKAMYKLSGKTVTQLSDETDLSIDTINNLFYARIQKPGLAGVNALVNAMGFSIQQLMTFLAENPDLPEDSDATELFTKYIASAADTNAAVPPAKETVKAAKGGFSADIERLSAEYEKKMDVFRSEQQRYADSLQHQYDRQIEQMQAYNRQMEQHFDKTTAALKDLHAQELSRMEKENARLRRTGKLLSFAVSIAIALSLAMFVLDLFNRSIGWLR